MTDLATAQAIGETRQLVAESQARRAQVATARMQVRVALEQHRALLLESWQLLAELKRITRQSQILGVMQLDNSAAGGEAEPSSLHGTSRAASQPISR